MHGKIDTAFPSTLSLAINPLTPPPQAPTLQPESAFRDYLQRLVTTTAVSQSVVVVALYYLCQARARLQPQLVIGDIVDKRYGYSICAASLMLANKFLDDNTYTSRTWATLSGFTLWEINDCERGLLSALDLQLNISLPQYNAWWRFLTMYGPSFTYPFTSASAVPEMTRPMTAEATAPLMKASTRRVPHVDLLSRPGSTSARSSTLRPMSVPCRILNLSCISLSHTLPFNSHMRLLSRKIYNSLHHQLVNSHLIGALRYR
jgi:hypothetical protein